jgi:hypothetical protein
MASSSYTARVGCAEGTPRMQGAMSAPAHQLSVDHSERHSALLEAVRRSGAFDVRMVHLDTGDYLIDNDVLLEHSRHSSRRRLTYPIDIFGCGRGYILYNVASWEHEKSESASGNSNRR